MGELSSSSSPYQRYKIPPSIVILMNMLLSSLKFYETHKKRNLALIIIGNNFASNNIEKCQSMKANTNLSVSKITTQIYCNALDCAYLQTHHRCVNEHICGKARTLMFINMKELIVVLNTHRLTSSYST